MIPRLRAFNNLQNRHIFRFLKSVSSNTVALSPTDFTVKIAQCHLNQYFKAYCHIT